MERRGKGKPVGLGSEPYCIHVKERVGARKRKSEDVSINF